MDPELEKKVALLMGVGGGLFVLALLGLLASFVLVFPAVYILMGLAALLGLPMLIAGLVIGNLASRPGSFGSRAAPRIISPARIVAKYAIDDLGQMLFNEEDFRPGVKFYVRIQGESGKPRELLTTQEVFVYCGEGLTGTANVEGNWLGSFTPNPPGGA